jgi:hypothetical protein
MTAAPPPAPLVRKLGIKPDSRVVTSGAPASLPNLIGELPPGARLSSRAGGRADVILVFATRLADLRQRLDRALPALSVDGGLWLCYPKRASAVATDLDFGVVQRIGLAAGLVDNKSVAVDDTWSGVRFVVRITERPTWSAPGPGRAAPRRSRPSARGPKDR